ncbi:hypothetical protein DLAC_03998 [Tieghemostelium lacteum]|uniref:Uncharacterized protein n=1 Tax=Tieghemostelium lacteum TaxID=361077 RepID=A0A151ZRZ6_TIELA|nr:hypothetical protein DLAC_03998 [Tieghemostelium lacteum]|eukprot:KYQ96705.1 hypothetical protein DLAC_03998 [Tieghemostelium lacteum]
METTNEYCNSNSGNIEYNGNRVKISNVDDYASISISPEVKPTFNADGFYFMKLKFNTSYTITATCKDQTVTTAPVLFTEGFSYEVTNAPCFGSFGSVQIYSHYLSMKMSINGNNPVTIAKDAQGNHYPVNLAVMDTTQVYFYTGDDFTQSCRVPLGITEITDKQPTVTTTPRECWQSTPNGKISVSNFASYTNITIGSKVHQGGNFTGLEAGPYVLVLTSNQCGEQSINVMVDLRYPRLNLQVDDSCPSNISVTPSTESIGPSSTATFTMDNNVNPPPWLITSNGQYHAFVSITGQVFSTCFQSRYFTIGLSLLPIRYEVVSSEIKCDDTPSVKIKIISLNPLLSLTDLQFQDIKDKSTFQLASDNTLTIPYDHRILVTANNGCFSNAESYTIYFPLPYPVINILGDKTGYCFENVSIYIPNYMDFTQLYMVNGGQPPSRDLQLRDENVAALSLYPVNGLFENIPRTIGYNLYFDYKNCSSVSSKYTPDPIGIRLQSFSGLYRPDRVSFQHKILTQPNCVSLQGQVEMTMYHDVRGLLCNQTLTYSEGEDIQFYCKIDDCYVNQNWTAPASMKPYTNPEFNITTTPAPCRYGTGQATITTNVEDYYLKYMTIDGIHYEYSRTINSLRVGNHTIVLYFKENWTQCSDSYSFNVEVESSDNTFEATIDSITHLSGTCDGAGGSITLPSGVYSGSLMLTHTITYQEIPITDTASGLSSGNYTFSFRSADGTCSGSTIVEIKSIPANSLTYSILRQPTCEPGFEMNDKHPADGIAVFKLNNGDAQIDKIVNYYTGDQTTGSWVVGVAPGVNIFTIFSQQCQYQVEFNATLHPPNFGTKKLYKRNCAHNNDHIRIYSNNSNVNIDNVEAEVGDWNPDGGILSGVYGESEITIYWNGVCSTLFTLPNEEFDLSGVPEYPKFEVHWSCDNQYNGYVQLLNPEKWIQVSLNGKQPDSLGRIYDLINFNDNEYVPMQFTYKANLCSESEVGFNGLPELDGLLTLSGLNIQNESCSGSIDGTLEFTGSSGYVYHLSQRSIGSSEGIDRDVYPNYLPYNTPADDSTSFTNMIGNFYYKVFSAPVSHPTCRKVTDALISYSQEPEIDFLMQCNADTLSYVANTSFPRVTGATLTLKNDTPVEVGGEYPASVEVHSPTCQRKFETSLVLQPPTTGSGDVCSQIDEPTTEKKKNNLGLILGLVLGLTALLFGVLVIAYFVYKSKKMIPEPKLKTSNPRHSVSIFTGGQIKQLDEF